MAKIVQESSLTSVADAIRAKTGGSEQLVFPAGFVSAIEGISGGGGDTNPVAQSKAVNFIDYDGTIRYSYTVEEAAALTTLPPLPTHDGLTCQGWNWSLADIKALGRAVTVGAMYITDDGKTRIYIHLEEGRTSPMLGCCPNGTVTVDWGDGTTPDTLTGTSTSTVKWTPTHEYAAAGDYVIKLTVSGTMGLYGETSGATSTGSGLLRYSPVSDAKNARYHHAVEKVEIGNGVSFTTSGAFYACSFLSGITIPSGTTIAINSRGAFGNCMRLPAVVLPDGITSISGEFFAGCSFLSAVAVPNGISYYSDGAFQSCWNLCAITIVNSLTRIYSNLFRFCTFLADVIIPSGITSIPTYAFGDCNYMFTFVALGSVRAIDSYAFYNCTGMHYYDFTAATSVPTLTNVNAFSGIPADCEIRVPIALYEDWKSATNWSAYADHIVYVGTPYYLNVSSNDGGTVTPTGQIFAAPGATRALKIVPDSTHDLSDITLDGTSVKSEATYADASANSCTVAAVEGAAYGFAVNTNGYYESQNKGKASSAAVCKIVITVLAETEMSLDIINSGESNYDYGLLGVVDQTLTATSTADSGVAWSGKGESSTSVVNVPFTIPAGTHFIYAKFIKDSSDDQDNDSLQFKVNLPTESYYSYTIENIQSDHDIVVTFAEKEATE